MCFSLFAMIFKMLFDFSTKGKTLVVSFLFGHFWTVAAAFDGQMAALPSEKQFSTKFTNI